MSACPWTRLPLPWLVRLCDYLPGRDLQRAADLFNWKALRKTEAYRAQLRRVTQYGKGHAFSTARPRKHRPYVAKCDQCDRRGRPCRPCSWRKCGTLVCDVCEPFDYETMRSQTICRDCSNEL